VCARRSGVTSLRGVHPAGEPERGSGVIKFA